MFEDAISLIQYAIVPYQEWWIQPWSLVPATMLMYYLIFALEFRLNGGDIPIWRGLWEEVRFFGPGGVALRIEFLKQYVFSDWKDCWQNGQSRSFAGEWSSADFAQAIKRDDQKTLREMSALLGSGWNTWVIRPIFSFIVALALPFLVACVVVAAPIAYIRSLMVSDTRVEI